MKCPNCGAEVKATDTINTEWYHNKYYDYVEGTCEYCESSFTWTEVYTFSHDEDITQIDPNDHL